MFRESVTTKGGMSVRLKNDCVNIFRLLLIEDDTVRVKIVQQWMPANIKLVIAPNAGTAIGIVSRDKGRVYGGIMIDHDLQQRAMTSMDRALSGKDVVERVIECISSDVPVLVHSMNRAGAGLMSQYLDKAGFDVTRIPFDELTREKFLKWIDEAYSLYEDEFRC